MRELVGGTSSWSEVNVMELNLSRGTWSEVNAKELS